ncbi:hypothetical protein [Nostoc sp.]|uniref:hypothetical protein n=1 Tax=Nostoc sp. TaxID=1180 RepID=UPI002FF881BA
MHWDALALQSIAKFNSLRINEMLYLECKILPFAIRCVCLSGTLRDRNDAI